MSKIKDSKISGFTRFLIRALFVRFNAKKHN
jgi:hypothetical protein